MLKLQTRFSRDAFMGPQNERMRVSITVPPVTREANRRLIVWLAKEFGIAKPRVTVETGHNTALKRVRIAQPSRIPASCGILRTA